MKRGRFVLVAAAASIWLASQPGCRPAGADAVTEIAKWQDGKAAAVSLTYDDKSPNQFRVAVPLMERLGFPATFHVITGEIEGSRYRGAFIGRPVAEIVRGSALVPTAAGNFFERASAIRQLGPEGGFEVHLRAGELFEDGRVDDAYKAIDAAFAEARAGRLGPEPRPRSGPGRPRPTWEELKALAARGFEFSSHTITHSRLAVLDDANLDYELEKSRLDLLDHLGPEQAFTVECPFGTEDDRVVRHALARYPASRNRMPEPFLEEIDRWNDRDPAASSREYVQWQRGVLTATPMGEMKGWADAIARRDNVWLVLVFHGVDGLGWEPKTGAELGEYFDYLKSLQDRLWMATFRDVTKYMRERMAGRVTTVRKGKTIEVVLRHDLPAETYDLPLTLKTRLPAGWRGAAVRQGGRTVAAEAAEDGGRTFVLYRAAPNAGPVTLRKSPR